ncbi:Flagellar basal-body rod protein FlgC [uncultured Desulfobacterium sp.]|uniref:Flagellar basal-body rod protein FlgC n=1 Tax=uncultured Desulfobacterium sp. TaxID=201089 RepID=A0A445MT44_9BACT|nr:Flagellar basal-body rod protein FlgC [uncultured Desulfobacterium sp.]
MNFFDSLQISASGLTSQKLRMNVISSNLANSSTTRTQEGGPYRRKDIVFSAEPYENNFESAIKSPIDDKLSQVKVTGIIEDPRPPIKKFDPGHPDADENGFVSLPNVNLIEEMVNMMSATRSYEANITAVNATKRMAAKALEIGR